MKAKSITVVAVASFVVVNMTLPAIAGGDADQCVRYGPRTDSGSSGVNVQNNCGYAVTFVVSGPNGMDYIALHSDSGENWTTLPFSGWKACKGWARTTC